MRYDGAEQGELDGRRVDDAHLVRVRVRVRDGVGVKGYEVIGLGLQGQGYRVRAIGLG